MERLNFSWLVEGEIAGHTAPASEEDLSYLKSKVIAALAKMVESHKVRLNPAQVEELGLADCYEPVRDFTAPEQDQIDRMIGFMEKQIAEGKPVGVSCGAGIGRTGTILACFLVKKCKPPEEAMEEVRRRRGAIIETNEQKEAVRAYAKHLGKSS